MNIYKVISYMLGIVLDVRSRDEFDMIVILYCGKGRYIKSCKEGSRIFYFV